MLLWRQIFYAKNSRESVVGNINIIVCGENVPFCRFFFHVFLHRPAYDVNLSIIFLGVAHVRHQWRLSTALCVTRECLLFEKRVEF